MSRPESGSNRLRLDSDRIVERIAKPLLTSQIPFGRLHAYMPEQELNLLQLTAALVAQP
jgi:hypothetical protein